MPTLQNVEASGNVVTFEADLAFGMPAGARILPARPNWKDRVQVELSYKTDTIRSRSGFEQRRALRATPRKKIGFRSLHVADNLKRLNNSLLGWASNKFVVPDPVREIVTTEAMAPGALKVAVERRPDWFKAGTLLSLTHGEQFGTRRLLFVGSSEILFIDDDVLTWPAGTRISPIILGRVNANTALRQLTSQVAEPIFDIAVEPLTDTAPIDDFPLQMYRGSEIFKRKPNWAQPLDYRVLSAEDVIDYDRGPIVTFDPEEFRRQQTTNTFLARTRDEIREIECFYRRMMGSRGSFFAPTWKDDLRLAEPFSAGAQQILVKGYEIAEMLSGDRGQRDIAFIKNDGTIYAERINLAELDGENSLITLEDPLPMDLASSDVRMMCWMPWYRLASDNLVLSYETDQVARIALTFTSLKQFGGATWQREVTFGGATAVVAQPLRSRAREAAISAMSSLTVEYTVSKKRNVTFDAVASMEASWHRTQRRSALFESTSILSVGGVFERIAEFSASSSFEAERHRTRRRTVEIAASSSLTVGYVVTVRRSVTFDAGSSLDIQTRKSVKRDVSFTAASSVEATFDRGFDAGFDTGFR